MRWILLCGSMLVALGQSRPVLPLVDGAAALNLIVRQVPPVYPAEAISTRTSGTVHVVVEIDADGKLQDTRVASGPQLLRQAALDSIRKWTFRPYLQGGKPSPARTTFDVVFKLP